MSRLGKAGRIGFGAAMAAVLALGAAQALATPAHAANPNTCNAAECDAACLEAGRGGGYCQFGSCRCYFGGPET